MIADYRTLTAGFTSLPLNTSEPRSVCLTQDKPAEKVITLNSVPGNSSSSLEKMTHPLAGCSDQENISPYMILLLGEERALAFAEKTLLSPRKRLLDQLGIDDRDRKKNHDQNCTDLATITRFYPSLPNSQPTIIPLNGMNFIVQSPTKPYFFGQKVITPDFTLHRATQEAQRKNLLLCKTRDDSMVFFDTAPVVALKNYNDAVFANERALRENDLFLNKTQYFVEMIEYLSHCSTVGDTIVQNSLETSSDKNTPHLQFIPGNVPLPLFSRSSHALEGSEHRYLDWYLPTLITPVDTGSAGWQSQVKSLQDACQTLLENQHISTTPVFRSGEYNTVYIYLIFKPDGSNMAPEVLQLAPGWLESCGIFIENTAKAGAFNEQGADTYYSAYAPPEKEQLLATLVGYLDH